MFIFNSYAMMDEVGPLLRRAAPIAAQHVVHNAVDLKAFCASPTPDNACRRVGMLAHLVPVKGHEDFLRMAATLSSRGIDADYLIIGAEISGSGYEQVLRRRAQELGLESRVQFLGHRDDIPQLLQSLDIVVCPSHVEPFGRCLIEAMACERPVVATRVGGIPEVVEDGVTGALVPPHSPSNLADAVERLIRDPQLGKQFGQAGRRRAVEHFSAESHVERVLELYGKVLRARGKKDRGVDADCGEPVESAMTARTRELTRP